MAKVKAAIELVTDLEKKLQRSLNKSNRTVELLQRENGSLNLTLTSMRQTTTDQMNLIMKLGERGVLEAQDTAATIRKQARSIAFLKLRVARLVSRIGQGSDRTKAVELEDPNESYAILSGAAGLLDLIKAEWSNEPTGNAWSEYDQYIRDGLTNLLCTALAEKIKVGEIPDVSVDNPHCSHQEMAALYMAERKERLQVEIDNETLRAKINELEQKLKERGGRRMGMPGG